jgi:hypothetical protein
MALPLATVVLRCQSMVRSTVQVDVRVGSRAEVKVRP